MWRPSRIRTCNLLGAIFFVCAGRALSATPGPSASETSAWIVQHLDIFYSVVMQGETDTYHAHFRVQGCKLRVESESKSNANQYEGAAVGSSAHFVRFEAMPGKMFNALVGTGTIDFSLIDLSSVRIGTARPGDELIGLGPTSAQFVVAPNDEGTAKRVAKAIAYLARRCGAKAAPF